MCVSQRDHFCLLDTEWDGWNLMCIIVPTPNSSHINLEDLGWHFYYISIFSTQFLKRLRKKTTSLSWHVPPWNLNVCFLRVICLHIVLFSDFPLGYSLFWLSCPSSVAYLSACCLFFLVFNCTTGSFRRQLGRGLVTVICSMYFCDDIFVYHRCTVRECTPMSLAESDNFLSPFPFTLWNSVHSGCYRIFLRDRIITFTSNNTGILVMLLNLVKQSAKQGYEQKSLNVPPGVVQCILWNRGHKK